MIKFRTTSIRTEQIIIIDALIVEKVVVNFVQSFD